MSIHRTELLVGDTALAMCLTISLIVSLCRLISDTSGLGIGSQRLYIELDEELALSDTISLVRIDRYYSPTDAGDDR